MQGNIFQRSAEDCERDASRFYERAEYYEQQGDTDKAFDNYVDSFNSYAHHIYFDEKGKLLELTSRQEVSYSIEDRLKLFFIISNRLSGISIYYGNRNVECAYIAAKQKVIFDAVSPYQRVFDVEQIKFYTALSKLVRLTSNLVNDNQEALEKISKIKPENEPDPTLKKIREALLRISETKLSLVKLESLDEGCFIATAAYSTPAHPDLDTFRSFRDKHLLTHPVGNQLVHLYYQIGPCLAQYVEKQPALKRFVRQQLGRLAQWMRSQGITSR